MPAGNLNQNPPPLPHYPTVEAIIDTIADWVGRARHALGARRELRECDPAEVRRIAQELGVTTPELYQLAGAKPGSADLVMKMLPALGIDPEALRRTDPLVMRDLQRLCVTCGNKRRCQHELNDGTAGVDYRQYCPNAVTLDALVEERGP